MAVKTRPAPVRLAETTTRITSSAIRDLLAVAERPEVISLAGGLPAPDAFPVEAIAAATDEVLRGDAAGALQYSSTAGHEPLRAWIAAQQAAAGGSAGSDPERVVVTHGSQQAIELLARALVEPGDDVALADPAYIGALQAFRLAGARLVGIPSDGDGMCVDVLAERIAAGARPRVVYVVSDFDNPSGATLSAARRRALAELAERHGFVIVVDDPYGRLRWSGQAPPPIATWSDRVVSLGTVSKVLAPGFRVGWAVAPPELAATLVRLKQAADLHTSTFGQRVVHAVLRRDDFLDGHVAGLRSRYSAQADALAAALRSELGERISFRDPEGGMFLWARIEDFDARARLADAVAAGVAYVPGEEFAVDELTPVGPDSVRLSFATGSPAQLAEAARRLTSVCC